MRANLVGRTIALVGRAGFMAILVALALTPAARADIIAIQSNSAASTDNLGTFTGSIDYGFNMALSVWQVKITLNNTSPAANGGFITALLFNIDSSDPNADATLVSSTNTNFHNLTNGNGQPFGNNYTAGSSLDNSFQGGGGNPNLGIPVGGSSMFTFNVSASDAASLTAADFINGPYQYDFIVRFRGFNVPGTSDKVPAMLVPGPTALTAMAIGIVMFPMRRRLRG